MKLIELLKEQESWLIEKADLVKTNTTPSHPRL